MKAYDIDVTQLRTLSPELTAGDRVSLSGTIYTARDAAHKKLFALLESEVPLPIPIKDGVIYYCGSTPAPAWLPIGACGPTTSGRMDPYAPRLYDLGLAATVGKGERSAEVAEAIKRNRAVYLCAVGGAGALAAKSVLSAEVIAFPELGCEAVKRLEIKNFPLVVGIDCQGGNLFQNSY